MKIITVVGARPNFIKAAPLCRAFNSLRTKRPDRQIQHLICHTGQHYDERMSQVFIDELGLPRPDFHLGVGSGTHAAQTGKIMIAFEKILLDQSPDLVIVVGDVNSTVACGLTAVKLGIKLAHVEAGLRSFDRTMPEEINRLLTDAISDYLFVSEKSGVENLRREGISEDKIFFVGNVMIDTLKACLPRVAESTVHRELGLAGLNGEPEPYILLTLHRPSNVDTRESLEQIVNSLNVLAQDMTIVFPVHPRTWAQLEMSHLVDQLSPRIIITSPVGYLDFLALMKKSALVITDSGGIQEETTFLGAQCITVRDNTERPVTVEVGTNQLAGTDWNNVLRNAFDVLQGNKKEGAIPELWDGDSATRIANILLTVVQQANGL